jgi:hypothetical protein
LVRIADTVSLDPAGRLTYAPNAEWPSVTATPYSPEVSREARYGAVDFGEDGVLGNGLVWVELTSGARAEDEIRLIGYHSEYEGQPLTLAGHPAIFTPTMGNGALVAELGPGRLVIVGWSGAAQGPDQIAAVQRIASRLVLLDQQAWSAGAPQVIDETPTATTLP